MPSADGILIGDRIPALAFQFKLLLCQLAAGTEHEIPVLRKAVHVSCYPFCNSYEIDEDSVDLKKLAKRKFMDVRIEKLVNAFLDNGWIKIDHPEIISDWWFDDIVKLNSLWRPTGKSLFLTFLTDPQNLKKKIVWAVGVSTELPSSKNSYFIKIVSLKEMTKIDLKEFVFSINNIILLG